MMLILRGIYLVLNSGHDDLGSRIYLHLRVDGGELAVEFDIIIVNRRFWCLQDSGTWTTYILFT